MTQTATRNGDIILSGEQKALFDVMESTGQHLFITGRAGAGKSVLLRHFRENTKKKVVIAAPTGIAALNVKGQTIHSLFKFPPNFLEKGRLQPNTKACTLLKRIDTIVIDEISMVRADLLDAIDERMREATKKDMPFGGKQVIMFGDVYQLPPVVDNELLPYFEKNYNGVFFFNALVWKEAEFKVFELTQVFRQKDPVFKDVLNAVRDGSVVDSQIEQLNARYGTVIPAEGTITLASTNNMVTRINEMRLNQLPSKKHTYQATITGDMKKGTFPTEEILQLKIGAQIVMLKNDKNARWVNGTVGIIEGLFADHIDVRINGIVYTVEKETWEEISYTYDQETEKVESRVTSSFTQYPIRLAWALTIHKSQGQTYESVALDLTTPTFAPGQMYVALSRCTSLEGLYLKLPVLRKHIITDVKVIEFMSRVETITVVEEEQPAETALAIVDAISSPVQAQETPLIVADVQIDSQPQKRPYGGRKALDSEDKRVLFQQTWDVDVRSALKALTVQQNEQNGSNLSEADMLEKLVMESPTFAAFFAGSQYEQSYNERQARAEQRRVDYKNRKRK